MKKYLFIFGIMIILSLFINNIYGYTIKEYTDYEDIFAYTVDDVFDYIHDKNITFSKGLRDVVYTEDDVNFIYDSDIFKEQSVKYPYYFICNNKILFFNKLPSYIYYNFTYRPSYDRINFNSNLVFDDKYNYCYYNINIENKTIYTDITERENVSSSLILSSLNYCDNYFYTRESIYSMAFCNFDLKFRDGSNYNKLTQFRFIPTFSENYKSCNLKLDIKNAPEYYDLKYAINSISSTWCDFDNFTGITVEENCLVIVKMLDENGDEIFANSYNVTFLENQISSTYFKVDFDTSQKSYLGFTPILYNNSHEMFDIKFSFDVAADHIASGTKVGFSEKNTATTLWKYYSNISDYDCQHGHTYWLRSSGGCTVYLKFELYNKNTGVLALTRDFEFKLSYDYPVAISSSTNGDKDAIFNSGAGSGFEDNLLASDSLVIDWDLDNSKETIKTFFETALSFFKLILAFVMLLPAWITVPLYTFFILAIVVFVFHVIRG